MLRSHASARVGLLGIVTSAAFFAASSASSTASAESLIREPNPPQYGVEIEPHFDLQDGGYDYGGGGFGFGARFSIPLMSPGFVRTINDSIAITFGGDLIDYGHGPQYCTGNQCNDSSSFWALYVPVAMQWNFFLSDQWSVFGEPGIAFRHAFFDCGVLGGCSGKDTARAVLNLGARWHFSDSMALTLRVGAPVLLSVGISFMPSPTSSTRRGAAGPL